MHTRTDLDRTAATASASLPDDLHPLIAALASHDVLARDHARRMLVDMGSPAVDPLIAAIGSPSHAIRWEAAKALSEIGDLRAVPALIIALDDVRFDVRWLAAMGLIALGEASLIPLLVALQHTSWDEGNLRESAHHILRTHIGGALSTILAPVVAALEGADPSLTVPLAAYHALAVLRDGAGG
ncbi:MAG: HEAT repeat domain-containing protein [Chloroflexales bacterium]